MAGLLAHNPGAIKSRHRAVNLLDPGHHPLPSQHRLDIIAGAIN